MPSSSPINNILQNIALSNLRAAATTMPDTTQSTAAIHTMYPPPSSPPPQYQQAQYPNPKRQPSKPSKLRQFTTFDTAVPGNPSTNRTPAIYAHDAIENPGVARANQAVSTEKPNGSDYSSWHREYTPLQQHILFWDRDADGQIYPWDTYIGFRDLGFNILFSLLAMLIININFSYPTRLAYSPIPDPWFRVYVRSIHKAKHGSDSGTYDPEGRFVPQAFENMFSKWDADADGALTFWELVDMVRGHRYVMDPFGWGAAFFEWGTTFLLIQKDGKVYKEDIRAIFDGSIFWQIREKRRKSPDGWTQGFGLGGDGFVGSLKMR